MKNLLATVIFTIICFCAAAQKAPFKFGTVPIEDLKMTRYEKDTSASAVILGDYGVSTINYNQSDDWFRLSFERTTRIKILTKEGYGHADFQVLTYHNVSDREKISGLKVITHNLENGKDVETKMKSDAVFDEKVDQNIDLVKFTAPNVKEGSIIEVTYKIDSDFLHYFRDWEFQSTIPVVWSEYRANIPEYFHYEKFSQGYVAFVVNEKKELPKSFTVTSKERSGGVVSQTTFSSDEIKYSESSFRWAVKDVPAFKEEPFMTTASDYISQINFELSYYQLPNQPMHPIMGTWPDLNRSLLINENFGMAVKGSGFLKKITEDITAGATTPQEKVAMIYDYVKSNVAWDGRYRMFMGDNFKTPLEEKKGSSAEINLLLVSMLQKAGLNASPVIISTRDNGFIRENIAISSQFNYVICRVAIDTKSILLDATDRLLPINLLPERCLNGKGYIISEESPGWVTLSAPKSKIYAAAEIVLQGNGELKGKINISNDGYDGYGIRKQYLKKGEEEYVKDFSHQRLWDVEKSTFENIKNINEPVKETYVFTHTENFGDASILYINPFMHLRLDENPFKLEDRVYPVDFGKATDRTFICKLTIPDGFQPEELPKPKALALPNNAGKYVYNVQASGNVITLTSVLSINQSLFTQNEYPALREFYNLVVAKQAEQIVLKKK